MTELDGDLERLRDRLAEANETIRALVSGEIDSALYPEASSPMLLRAAQQKLAASERLLRAVFEGSHDANLIADDEGRYVEANPAACAMFGMPKEQLLGRRIAEFAAPEHALETTWDEFLRAGHHEGVFLLLRPDGERRVLEYTATANVLPGHHLSVLRDVTQLREATRTLQESRRLMEEAQAVAHLGSWSAGAAPEAPISWSRECARIFGRDVDQAPTLSTFFQMAHPDDRARVISVIEASVRQGTACETEHRIVQASGEVRWVYSRSVIEGSLEWSGETPVPKMDGDGRPYRVVGAIQDITERKRVQDELRASDARYRRIVENTSEGVWMYDPNGITTFMNKRMTEMLAITPEEGIGRSIYSFMDEVATAEAKLRMERRKRGLSERGEFRLKRSDGSDLWVTLHADPLFDAVGNFEGSLVLLADFGERRRGDAARALLASIVESSADAIISRGLDGTIRTWNRGAEKLTLYTAAEAIGQPISMMYPPEYRSALDQQRTHVDRGESLEHFEMVALRKDGTRVDVALSSSVLSDEHGQVTGASIIVRDISERKKAEVALRRTEEQLRQAQKMEAIGSLAGGVAHDFNNLLTVILSYTELIVEDLQVADPMRQDLEEVLSAGRRAMGLTRQLLAFSRKQMLVPVVIDLNEVVLGVEKMLGRLLGEDIELAFHRSPRPARVHADTGQIEQVIMNLVVNARDAMPTGGSLTIETSIVMLDAAKAEAHAGLEPGEYVMLAITDTGTGMDRLTQDRIFEPFFTTKDKSKGTGLGLSTVYGIVQQSGGRIVVDSEPGKGTAFKVYLPRTDRHATSQSIPVLQADRLRGTETILLVEDDTPVRVLMRTVLRKCGYRVIEAENAGEAFLLSEEPASKIHLLITDVVMPRMGGRQLAERLVVQRPDMKVLFVSGYTEDTVVRHGVIDGEIEFLAKPLTPDSLLRKVRNVLDGRTRTSSNAP
jgi:two-component system cell cycle sensor histidine kinase/response regulator CckA